MVFNVETFSPHCIKLCTSLVDTLRHALWKKQLEVYWEMVMLEVQRVDAAFHEDNLYHGANQEVSTM